MVACRSCGFENPQRARFCLECGAPVTAPDQAANVRKVVTVLFCDMTGSTALGEAIDPEAVRGFMGRYFETARRAVEEHGGIVEKYIGDAVMAVFGIPQLHEDDALRAVRAATRIQADFATLRGGLPLNVSASLDLRIGINTGEVVAGDPETQTLVTGDAVNSAARLEQAAPAGAVLIGDLTHRLVRGRIEATRVEPISAKGKADPMVAYRVDSAEASSRIAAHSDLVGREAELDRLLAAVRESSETRSLQLVTVVGHAGVGKSRLLNELEARVRGAALVIGGRCLPYGDGVASWPVRGAFRELANINDGDTTPVVVAKLAALAAPDEAAHAIGDGVAYLMGVAGAAAGQDDAFWAFRKLLERLARDRPVIALFEDLHWADPIFLDLLEYVTDLAGGAALTLVASARPDLLESRPSWGGGRDSASLLRLEPLEETDVRALCRSQEGGEGLTERALEQIAESAEGNPLFVEEMVAAMRDDGTLRAVGDGWSMGNEALTIPPTVRALIAARIDRLPVDTRIVAARAAVIGRVFETRALAQISPPHVAGSLTGHLLSLVRRDFVRPSRSDIGTGDAYVFRHVLIRDTAYEALSKQERAELHERLADWIERVSGEDLSQYQEVVAHHLEEGSRLCRSLGDHEQAATLARRAADHLADIGDRALAAGAVEHAGSVLRRAIGLAEDPPPTTLLNAGDALARAGDPDGIEFIRKAVESATGTGDEVAAALATAVYAMYEIGMGTGSVTDTLPRIEGAIEVLERVGDHAGLARAYGALSYAYWGIGRLTETRRAADLTVTHARAAGLEARARRSMAVLSGTLYDGPTPIPEAIDLCHRMLEEIGESRNARYPLLESLAWLVSAEGRYEDARRYLEEGIAIADELGQSVDNLYHRLALAELEANAGRLDEAEVLATGVPEQLETMGSAQAGSGWAILSRIHTDRGNPSLGLATLRDEPPDDADVFVRGVWLRSAALAHLRLGNLHRAEQFASKALSSVDSTDLVIHQAESNELLAAIAAARDDVSAAEQRLRASQAIYRAKQSRVALERVNAALVELGHGN
jgi:class 3 adenylate cyclase/tetratricopeptide (TPR) repeat protein